MARTYSKGITNRIKEYFYQHPNEIINIYHLVDVLGLEKKQIQSAITNSLLTEGSADWIEIIQRGQQYRYTPQEFDVEADVEEETQESAMRTVYDGVTDDEKGFYMIQTSTEGLPIIQRDFDGTIWIAHPV